MGVSVRRATDAIPPVVALGIAILAVSTSAILIRYSSAPTLVIALYRVLFTTVLLLPFAVHSYRDAFYQLSRRDWIAASAAGVALALHFALWFESLAWTSVAASVTIVQIQVLFVASGAADTLFAYPPYEWFLFILMALGPGILGHTVLNWALAHVESSVVSVSLLAEPVCSTVLAVVLLSELPTRFTAIGGAMTLIGIIITSRR